jgi:hypothetical protein
MGGSSGRAWVDRSYTGTQAGGQQCLRLLQHDEPYAIAGPPRQRVVRNWQDTLQQ